jgi:hypothetical protein
MRTKTLLIAIGALTVGAFSSMAQVESVNVVGYANVATPGSGGTYYLLACPFQIGTSNGVNEVFGTTLPDFSEILTWNVTSQTYNTVLYDSTQPTPGISWYLSDDATPVTDLPTIPAGQGFFLLPSSPITNAFVGTVAVNIGATNLMSLPGSGGTYFLVGSTIPFSGALTNTPGIQLTNMPDFSEVLAWNVTSQTYVTSLYDSTQPTPGDTWYQSDDATPAPVPTASVGAGFFVLPSNPYIWQQTLNP